jgi:chaperonin GroES
VDGTIFHSRKIDLKIFSNLKIKGVKQMADVNIKPLGDRVLVEICENNEEMKGGILIPDTAKEKPQEYRVVALGTGKNDEKGEKIPFDVKVGDIVLTSRYGGTEVKVDGKEYKVVNQDDILAIVG